MSPKRIACKVSAAAEKRIVQRHPWVFESSISKQNKEAGSGDLAVIFGQEKNNLIAVGLFDPISPIRIKLISFFESAELNEDWFRQKILVADAKRTDLKTHTDGYRLIHGENDGLPGLIVDAYANNFVIKLYSNIWYPYFDLIKNALIETQDCKSIVFRSARNLKNTNLATIGIEEGDIIFGESDGTVLFSEFGLQFKVDIIHGHKTGFFLDQRTNRHKVSQISKGKKVLDVFSYAGGFTVHAFAGGAKEVASLDISKHAIASAKHNVSINFEGANHKTICDDAFSAMHDLVIKKEKFDVIIIDPPSFAKREREIKTALNKYAELAKLAARLINLDGILVLASCSSRVSSEQFFKTIHNCLEKSNHAFDCIEKTYHDDDHPITFPEAAYLKCGFYKRTN